MNNSNKSVRVRFAPSPTGYMHLGNVRAALINYLFARHHKGAFILRIEDTDKKRNFDTNAEFILQDLAWLNLDYDEGPLKGGPYEPYVQSERAHLYQEYLDVLKQNQKVYRCFCTQEELEAKRKRQITLKQPPRYDRTCLNLTEAECKEKANTTPYIWRFKLEHNKTITVNDLARKEVIFNLSNFSDFPLTRQDGSFTFMFANFVDDHTMKISHIFRGEDHLTNTAGQAALYDAFNAQIPLFYHLPILINDKGKKLSKRDFGFSLNDLKHGGFLPEAINNYLALIGASFKKEIMSLEELISTTDFNSLSAAGCIRYDLEKLRWINQQWILKLSAEELALRIKPFLKDTYNIDSLDQEEFITLTRFIQPEMVTLKDSINLIEFYIKNPDYDINLLNDYTDKKYKVLSEEIIENITKSSGHYNPEEIIKNIKNYAQTNELPLKKVFTFLRIVLTGKTQGPGVKDLFFIIKPQIIIDRFHQILQKLPIG